MTKPLDTLDTMDVLDQLSELVRSRRSSLAAIARAEGVTPEDAVDCVQEALSTFLSRPPPENDWAASLALIVRNAARNRRRRHFNSQRHQPLDDLPLAAAAPPVDELIARAEEHVRLRACVEELCEIQRAVVTLRMLEEQPGEDVARALGITAAHVAVLLHRAKQSLRSCMTAPLAP
jgi:RNA polymerase sigma-70 factor (ECF subfamily)